MSIQIAVRLSTRDTAALDDAVARGSFPSRAAALRRGLELLLREEREREIEAAYRRGYGEQPQEEWTGQAGLAAFAEMIGVEERDQDAL